MEAEVLRERRVQSMKKNRSQLFRLVGWFLLREKRVSRRMRSEEAAAEDGEEDGRDVVGGE